MGLAARVSSGPRIGALPPLRGAAPVRRPCSCSSPDAVRHGGSSVAGRAADDRLRPKRLSGPHLATVQEIGSTSPTTRD